MPRIFTAGMGPDLIEGGGIYTTGYHPEAMAYRAKLVAAGVTPTPAQMAALTTFFGQTWGLAGKVLQSLVPVWGNAVANRASLFPSAFGALYSGAAMDFTGKKARSTGDFLYAGSGPDFVPSVAGMTSVNSGQAYFAIDTSASNFVDCGARTGSGTSSNLSLYQYGGTIYASAGTAGNLAVVGGVTPGLVAHNCTAATQRLTFQNGGGFSALASAAPASGSVSTVVMLAHALHEAGVGPSLIPTTRSYGAFAWWKGMSHAEADTFTQALYTLTNALRA